MEFEQYLEKDILEFLDSKINKKEKTSIDREEEYGLYLTKDYLKELNYALDNDELTRAKKLFDELKANYSRLPKSSVERKKIYSLLQKMYEKIQNYVRIKEGKIEVIKQGNMEIFKDTTEKFSSLADRMQIESSESAILPVDTVNKSELPKRTMLPIGLDKNNESEFSKKHFSEEETFSSEKKTRDKNSFAVESNIIGISLKDKLEKTPIKETKYVKKEVEPSENEYISQKNVFRNHVKNDEINRNQRIERTDNLEWKNEIMNRDYSNLEKVKMHVIDKLLEKLHKKFDEDNSKQNKKIESLRSEIVHQVFEELNKRLKKEESVMSNNIENLRKEILNKIYHEAQSIISSKDNQNNIDTRQDNTNKIDDSESDTKQDNTQKVDYSESDTKQDNTQKVDYSESDTKQNNTNKIKDLIYNEKPLIRKDELIFVRDKPVDKFANVVKTKQTPVSKFSGEELRVVYEQAIYYMFDNKYNEAAKLFRKIITLQPKNKAAHIRLQECIEKQPELSEDNNIESYSEFNIIIEPSITNLDEESIFKNDCLTEKEDNITQYIQNVDNFKNNTTERVDAVDTFAKETINSQKYILKHKYTNEELQNMYEEAVCKMFQNNYNEAAKILDQDSINTTRKQDCTYKTQRM